MKVILIDYNAGNTRSVQFALERLGVNALLSADPDQINSADKIIFPGVGNASYAMKELRKRGLVNVIRSLKQDTLGICLGMQLMCNQTEEGNETGLGIFNTDVKRFSQDVKVPQIGWNTISTANNPIFANIKDESFFYFVHSYYVPEITETIGFAEYGIRYSAALQKDNFYACQFHPEKSWKTGEQLIKNFLEL